MNTLISLMCMPEFTSFICGVFITLGVMLPWVAVLHYRCKGYEQTIDRAVYNLKHLADDHRPYSVVRADLEWQVHGE